MRMIYKDPIKTPEEIYKSLKLTRATFIGMLKYWTIIRMKKLKKWELKNNKYLKK
ncbi:hypothetical protein SAMN05421800_1344 [Chryseobacterium balustinum]|uniref:Uncharacterized protein n=1 Tax=Chryseobacterium balustinum TaxID=246 RepID=A0ABY1LEM2_9FLAO|nr:hypothetical protein SAMN05421800_1344 [Chryseobacterium balustinum]